MFPFALTLGLAAATLWLALAEPLATSNPETAAEVTGQRLEAGLAAFVGALILSRSTFVLLHLARFVEVPLTALALWQGGLTGWGAALGGLAGLFLAARRRRQPFWSLLDALAGPASLVALSAWLGCSLDGCAYGRRAAGNLLALPGPDLIGQIEPRWPTQTLGALGSIGLFTLSLGRQRFSWAEGTAGLAVWQGHALLLLGISWLRADPIGYFGPLRSDTLGAAIMLLTGAILYMLNRKQGDHSSR